MQRHEQRLVLDAELEPDARVLGTLAAPVDRGAQHRLGLRLAERDDLAPLLELAQEEDVIDELGHLLDLGLSMREQYRHVGVGQLGGFQQRHQPGERRA